MMEIELPRGVKQIAINDDDGILYVIYCGSQENAKRILKLLDEVVEHVSSFPPPENPGPGLLFHLAARIMNRGKAFTEVIGPYIVMYIPVRAEEIVDEV